MRINFDCHTDYLKRSSVTIYRAKCLGMVTLTFLPLNCFRYNSEKQSTKFPITKMNLNIINVKIPVEVLSSVNKIFKGF